MARYRMEVAATICFDVIADDDKEARRLARELISDSPTDVGIATDIGDDDADARLYTNPKSRPVVVDITDEVASAD